MKRVRLLPIVVFAAGALLLFKSIGLVTEGGYVLLGPTAAVAAGDAHPPAESDAASGEADGAVTLPDEPTASDTSPTIADTAPTLGAEADAGHGGGHGEQAAAEGHEGGHAEPAGDNHGETHDEPEAAAHGTDAAADEAPAAHAGEGHGAPPAHGEALSLDCAATQQERDATIGAAPCVDATELPPLIRTGDGSEVPLGDPSQLPGTEEALLERLGERRTELETYAEELEMRAALVEAAERRIDQRTAALAELEARINALVEEKKAIDDGQFAGIVSMYENMRPGEAAAIFNELDTTVLLRVARAMNPRKMAPVLAKMTPTRAQEVTIGLASLGEDADPSVPSIGMDAADDLPQIVGQ